LKNLVRLNPDYHKLVNRSIMDIAKTATVEANVSLLFLQKGSTPPSTKTLTNAAKRVKAGFDTTPMFELFEAQTEDFAKDTAELEAKIDDDTFKDPVTRDYVDAKQTELTKKYQRCCLALFKCLDEDARKVIELLLKDGMMKGYGNEVIKDEEAWLKRLREWSDENPQICWTMEGEV
jgi:hypothetical protein